MDKDIIDFDDWLESQPEGTFVQGGGIQLSSLAVSVGEYKIGIPPVIQLP